MEPHYGDNGRRYESSPPIPSTSSHLRASSEPIDLEKAWYLHNAPGTTSAARARSQSCWPSSQQANSQQREDAWTSSKTWMSDEEKERKRWKTIQANISHYGFDKSPFVPRTFQEYLECKLQTAATATGAAYEQLRQREKHAETIRRHLCAGKPLEQLEGNLAIPRSLLKRAKEADPLSPVLARPSMWTDATYFYKSTNWPGVRELKDAGYTRSLKGRSRFFPAPRTTEPDDEPDAKAKQNGVPLSGPSMNRSYIAGWALQSVKYDLLVEHEVHAQYEPAQELELSEINETIQGLIEQIHNMA